MIWPEHKMQLDDLELCLVPHIGGRLMDVRFKGTSLLFQNPDLLERLPNLDRLNELPSRASHIAFPLWGGEKTWLAPDSEWPNGAPHSILDSGHYRFENHQRNTATMTSSVCPQSSMQIVRTIKLEHSKHWTINHQVTNKGLSAKSVGIWSVMMTRAPASYLFRLANGSSPTTVFGDALDAYSCESDISQISCDTRREFKLGAHPTSGLAGARIPTEQGVVWIVNTAKIDTTKDKYAHGHALEFYNSEHYDYGELEWHSPAITLPPEQSLNFTLKYHLILEPKNTSAIDMFRLIEKHSEVEQ